MSSAPGKNHFKATNRLLKIFFCLSFPANETLAVIHAAQATFVGLSRGMSLLAYQSQKDQRKTPIFYFPFRKKQNFPASAGTSLTGRCPNGGSNRDLAPVLWILMSSLPSLLIGGMWIVDNGVRSQLPLPLPRTERSWCRSH